MITEDYVSFETAKLLKEKGFDCKKESITAMYREDGEFYSLSSSDDYYYDYNDFDEYDYIAPTLQMAMKWLRDVHNLWCEISWEGKGLWCMEVFSLMNEEFMPGSIVHEIKSYEEACEAAIKYCLENLI